MRYYISDLHFFHENLNHSLDCRGFASAHEMNEYIIEKWNKKVREGDEVVILGDFSAGHAEETLKCCAACMADYFSSKETTIM